MTVECPLDSLLSPEYLLESEARCLAEHASDPQAIVRFLHRKPASRRIGRLAGACIGSVVAVGALMWTVVFFAVAPHDAPEEPHAVAILSTIMIGGGISLAICLQVYFYAKQRGQAALDVLRNSTETVCVQGIQAYEDEKARERTGRVHFPCPSCTLTIVAPEIVEAPGEILCEGCSARLGIVVSNGASDHPVFLTDTQALVLAGHKDEVTAVAFLPMNWWPRLKMWVRERRVRAGLSSRKRRVPADGGISLASQV